MQMILYRTVCNTPKVVFFSQHIEVVKFLFIQKKKKKQKKKKPFCLYTMSGVQVKDQKFPEKLSASVLSTYRSSITKAITWVIVFQWSEAIKHTILKIDPEKKFILLYPILFTLLGAILITLIELL